VVTWRYLACGDVPSDRLTITILIQTTDRDGNPIEEWRRRKTLQILR